MKHSPALFLICLAFCQQVNALVVRLDRIENLSSPVDGIQKMLHEDRKLELALQMDSYSKAKQSGIEISDILN